MREAELPDGTVLEFPDGTSDEVMSRAVKAHLKGAGGAPAQPAPVPTAPAEPPSSAPSTASEKPRYLQRAGSMRAPQSAAENRMAALGAGVMEMGLKGVLSLKQAVGLGSEDDQYALKGMELENQEETSPGMRLGGKVAAGVGMSRLPGVKQLGDRTFRGVRAVLPTGTKTIGGAAASSGATSLALTPGQGETAEEQDIDRAKKAGTDSLWGGVLGAGGALLKKAATGFFKPNSDAKQLFDQGVNPTMQQAGSSWLTRTIGGLAAGAENVPARQNREVIASYIKQFVDPNLDTKNMRVDEMIGLMEGRFKGDPTTGAGSAFDQILGNKKFTMTPSERASLWSKGKGGSKAEPEVQERGLKAMGGLGTAFTSSTTVTMKAHRLQKYRDRIQYKIDRLAKGDPIDQEVRENLVKMKDQMDDLVRDKSLTPDERDMLRGVQDQYDHFKMLAEAADKPGFHRNPRAFDVLTSFKNEAKRTNRPEAFRGAEYTAQQKLLEPAVELMGLNPTQDASRGLVNTMRRAAMPTAKALGAGGLTAAGGPLVGIPLGAAYGVSLLGQSAKGSRALFGQGEKQKALAELLRKNPQFAEGLAQSGYSLTPGE